MATFKMTHYQNGMWTCIRPDLSPWSDFDERERKWGAVKAEYGPRFAQFGLKADDEALGFSIQGWHGTENAHDIANRAYASIVGE